MTTRLRRKDIVTIRVPVETGHSNCKIARTLGGTELRERLTAEYGYTGSYRSVLRYVRAKYPKAKIHI